MRNLMFFRSLLAIPVMLVLAAMPTASRAADTDKVQAEAMVDILARSVDLFDAIESGKVDVKFIPRDATQANIIFKNLTDEEVLLRLPETFGAIHINAQMGMGGMGGGMGGMGGGQGMGGGMGGMGGGMMGGGMGGMGGGMGGMGGGMGGMGGMMRVAPAKTEKLKVQTLCLEHGKLDPKPKMTYKLVRLEDVNADPRVGEICKMLAKRKVAQNTAQAAAWHVTDEMDWRELAAKNRVESQYTGNIPFFNIVELRQAMVVLSEAERLAEQNSSSETSESRYAESE